MIDIHENTSCFREKHNPIILQRKKWLACEFQRINIMKYYSHLEYNNVTLFEW